jgi:hypothetical protein
MNTRTCLVVWLGDVGVPSVTAVRMAKVGGPVSLVPGGAPCAAQGVHPPLGVICEIR